VGLKEKVFRNGPDFRHRPDRFFFCNFAFFRNKFMFGPLNDLMSFLDPLLSVMSHGAEVTRLGAMGYGAEVPGELATRYELANDVAYLGATICNAELGDDVDRVMAVGPYVLSATTAAAPSTLR
jgi:hypothetical protein